MEPLKIQQFAGHSGAEVWLMRKEGKLFVRKIITGEKAIIQARKSVSKQEMIRNVSPLVTRIIDQRLDNNFFVFDQEYVPGFTLGEQLFESTAADARVLCNQLVTSLSELHKIGGLKLLSSDVLKKQIIRKIGSLTISRTIKNVLNEKCRRLPTTTLYFSSSTHGDLTLENCIVDGDQIAFIDIYEGYSDCCLLDFSKLYFDLHFGWSFRHKKNIDTASLRHFIEENIYFEFSEKTMKWVKFLSLIDCLRIVPYASVGIKRALKTYALAAIERW